MIGDDLKAAAVAATALAEHLNRAREGVRPVDLFDVLMQASFLDQKLAVLRKHDPEAQRRVDLLHERAQGIRLIRGGPDDAS